MDDLTDTIEELAQSPQRASGDAGSVEMPKVGDVIAADRYGKAQASMDQPHRGVRFTKLIPPGAA